MNKFLFELGTEEVPAEMIPAGLSQLAAGLQRELHEQGVDATTVRTFSSPRRLAVILEGLPKRQPDREEITQGPPQSIGLDEEGRPTQAAAGFARKLGLQVQNLEVVETERGPYLVARKVRPGRDVRELLVEALPGVLSSIEWPKTMVWRESRFRFVRPLRWFVTLWNDQVLDFSFEGVQSGRRSRGHRFLSESPAELASVDDYVPVLRHHFVLVDLEERRTKIARELKANIPEGLRLLQDEKLEATVAYLNEFPSVLRGGFDPKFLEIPQEVLITVMRHHQKYFAIVDGENHLQPWFLTVLNTSGDPKGRIQKGHERVLKARLEDAAFFWDNDRKVSLEARVEALADVVFQQELGSYLEKTQRICKLCTELAVDPDLQEAARLCKADLTTDMVFEMPELQGVMGGLYARSEGKPEAVWRAIYEHYRPVALEDESPETRSGALLSLADRLDTIVGCFSVGIRPTGSSDPFALRRQAQGAIKILLDHQLDFSIRQLVKWAAGNFAAASPEVQDQVVEFLLRRVRFLLQERGLSYDVLNAAFAVGADQAYETCCRAEALQEIRSQDDFEALAVAFKRIRNILTKESQQLETVQPERLIDPAEQALYQAYCELRPQVESLLQGSDFSGALTKLASLRGPVDDFFDQVMVLTEDEKLRANRLRLLQDLSDLFLRIADISEIVRKD